MIPILAITGWFYLPFYLFHVFGFLPFTWWAFPTLVIGVLVWIAGFLVIAWLIED